MIDTIHPVHTPEGVELELRVAGPVARALAWLLDALLRGGLLLAAAALLGMLGGFGAGLMSISAFLIWWFFPVAFEMWGGGQTPGKRALGLRVVCRDGTPVDWSGSILRNFLRVVDFLPAFYAVGLISMLIDSSFRRLGDLAANTLVVYAERAASRSGTVPDVVPLAPPFPLALEEQRAVISFVERSAYLTTERAVELASLAEPLVGADDPRQRLERIAAFLVGRGGRDEAGRGGREETERGGG